MGHVSLSQLTIIISALVIVAPVSAGFHIQPAYATTPTGVIVPLYTYPSSSTWDTVAKAKTSYPSVPIIAIVNPSNGPGGSKDSNFDSGIQKLNAAGVTVLGYVYTSYGSRSESTVRQDISTYSSWYKVSGIFFDEMSSVAGKESYYKSLSDYSKSLGLAYTVGNPGADTTSSYIGTVDNIIIYENSGLPTLSYLGGWHADYDKKNFSIMPYAVGSLDKSYVSNAASKVGNIYITTDNLPNPWDSLPSYFNDLVSAVNAADGSTSSTTFTLKVKSKDLGGNKLNGMWTTISQGDTILKTGFTPLPYKVQSGSSYEITVADYQNYVFDHWENGSTDRTRTVTPMADSVIIAYYRT